MQHRFSRQRISNPGDLPPAEAASESRMERKHRLLNLTFLLWFLALLAWCLGSPVVAGYSGLLAVTALIIYLMEGRIVLMFKKQKPADVQATVNVPVPATDPLAPMVEKHTNTVIASDVHVEGNIVSSTPVYIHGSLHGNITAPEGLIKVMRKGVVHGNISCRELIIDGTVVGQCVADSVEVYENGKVDGTLAYRHIAVKKGGEFSGQVEILPPVQEKTNVIGLKIDAPLELSTDSADEHDGQKKSQHPAG